MYRVLFACWVILFSGSESASIKQNEDGKAPFELNEFLGGSFGTRSFNGTWLSGDTFMHMNSERNFVIYNVTSREISPFFDISVLTGYPGVSISISNDQNYLLLRYNVVSVFRHSVTAQYTIYDLNSGEYYLVAEGAHLQLVRLAPIGFGLAYVLDNDIYYLGELTGTPRRITSDGVPGIIYNGVPDWVYEEEVFGSGSAVWFSPDGSKLAYATFNDTEVAEFDYFIYGTPGSIENQYPRTAKIRYPKVSTTNPIVHIYAIDLLNDEAGAEEISGIPNHFLPRDNVLYDLAWITNNQLAVISSNRIQNESELMRCGFPSINGDGDCVTEATYQVSGGWLDIHIPKFSEDGSRRLEILPQPEGDDRFDHLVLTNAYEAISTRLTNGRYVVTSVYGWDETNDLIYFTGTGVGAPSQQHVYVVNVITMQTECLTCQLETPEGLCLYGGASFSKDLSHVAIVCQGPGPYVVQVRQTRDPSDVLIWENNEDLRTRLAGKLQPAVINETIPLKSGFVARARLFLPPNLNETGKYPAIVNVYAGPDSNQISYSYSPGLQLYLTTNRKYIYIQIDGRGSGRDGQKKKFTLYKKFATVEIEDQIEVTKYLQEKYSFIDANNTGIWGWSYGGFATAWVLAKDTENVFKCGVAVAPVTNFIFYDTIYTERYMGFSTEEDNLGGYNDTDVSRNVEGFRNKLFLLIHGNADDNVHYQQSMVLSRALELADIPFQQQSYPDENHSIGGTSPHLYHTLDRFWARSFGLSDPPVLRFTPPAAPAPPVVVM